jgi:hypothetical protein
MNLSPELEAKVLALAGAGPPPTVAKRPKYGNRKVELDGHRFDSEKEATRYLQLKAELLAGAITDLELQVPFDIRVGDVLVCRYVSDFCYRENGELVIEDVKSAFTRKNPVYRIKAKLMAAQGLHIRET